MATSKTTQIVRMLVLALVLIALVLGLCAYGLYWMYQRHAAQWRTPDPVAVVEIPKSDQEYYSLPEDPWSIPAVPIDTFMLVLPFHKGGKIDEQSFLLMRMIATEWIVGMPRNASAAWPDFVSAELGRMSAYTNTETLKYDPAHAVQFAKFFNPTHTLSGEYREEGGDWILEAKLEAGFRSDEKTFRVKAKNDYELSARVCEWMASHDLIPPEGRSAVCGYPFGRNVLSSDSDLYRAMKADVGHPEWTRLIEESKTEPRRLDLLVQHALTQQRGDVVEAIDPGPTDLDSTLQQRLLRSHALKFYQQTDALRHECELVLAAYPGDPLAAKAFIFDTFEEGQMRDAYVASVENWLDRTRPNGLSLTWAAAALGNSAWDWRGTGWANTVSENASINYQNNNLRAIQLYERSISHFAPLSYPTAKLIGAYGAASDHTKMESAFELAASTYPGYVDSWENYLNYLRPRWGGSHPEAMAVIDRALDDHPDYPNLGQIVYSYHSREASLEVDQNVSEYKKWEEYHKMHPDREKQFRRGIEHLASDGAHPRDVCQALRLAVLLRDTRLRARITKKHNGYHTYATSGRYGNITADLLYACLISHLENSRFDEANEVYEMAMTHDTNSMNNGSPAWAFVFQDNDYRDQVRYFIDAMLSESAPPVEWSQIPVEKWGYYLYCKFLLEGVEPDDKGRVERLANETTLNVDYLTTFILKNEGKQDEARTLARKVLDDDTIWDAFKPSFEQHFLE